MDIKLMRYKFIGFIIFICFACFSFASENEYEPYPNFQIPPEFIEIHSYHPVTYLELYPVKDPSKQLDKNEKRDLAILVIAANEACLKKYHQSYFIDTNCPIFKLILTNFPKLQSKNWEGKGSELGGVCNLNDLSDFLKKHP